MSIVTMIVQPNLSSFYPYRFQWTLLATSSFPLTAARLQVKCASRTGRSILCIGATITCLGKETVISVTSWSLQFDAISWPGS